MSTIFKLSVLVGFALISCEVNSKNEGYAEQQGKPCACEDLNFDEPYNHFFIHDRTKPYSGECKDFYGNGQLKLEKYLVEGKNHGVQKKYFETGQMAEIAEFDMNFQIGEQINFDRNGDTTYHASYNRGKLKEIIKITRDYEVVR